MPLQLQIHYSTLQIQPQLRYTTLHKAVVGESTTATIAPTSKNTTPTTFRSISGFTLPFVIHNNHPGSLLLNLPPPPCAVLLVFIYIYTYECYAVISCNPFPFLHFDGLHLRADHCAKGCRAFMAKAYMLRAYMKGSFCRLCQPFLHTVGDMRSFLVAT